MSDGLLDTNIFIHAHANDEWSEECRAFLAAVEAGRLRAFLEPLIVNELSYALPHYLRQITKEEVADYLTMVLSWEGIRGDKDLMLEAVGRWRNTPGLSFVDAYLAALATKHQCPVYSKNVRELERQRVAVPQPLLA